MKRASSTETKFGLMKMYEMVYTRSNEASEPTNSANTALALSQGGYVPGVATAPVLLAVSTYLAVTLSAARS